MASGLARVGPRSGPSNNPAHSQTNPASRFQSCCAPQRGQARSPHITKPATTQKLTQPPTVASGLARVGSRSGPSKNAAHSQANRASRFQGCCAPQRGQARSPHITTPATTQKLAQPPTVASGLARVGPRSGPSKNPAHSQANRASRLQGCCAAQRGQARSPHIIKPATTQKLSQPPTVASGLARVGPRSGPSKNAAHSQANPNQPLSGLLRPPTRASPLATRHQTCHNAETLTARLPQLRSVAPIHATCLIPALASSSRTSGSTRLPKYSTSS